MIYENIICISQNGVIRILTLFCPICNKKIFKARLEAKEMKTFLCTCPKGLKISSEATKQRVKRYCETKNVNDLPERGSSTKNDENILCVLYGKLKIFF